MNSWAPAEQALRTWIRSATGLGDGRVIFGEQNGFAPIGDGQPELTVSLSALQSIGVDHAQQKSVDTTAKTVTFESVGAREVIAQLRAYALATNGDTSARALLDRVQRFAAFDDVLSALNDAGLGLLDLGDVMPLPKVVNAKWESQATLEVRFCALVTAELVAPYIAHVNGQGVLSSPGGTPLTVPIHVDLP